MELIYLVNSVIIFLPQMNLLKWLTFLLGSLTVTHSPAFLDLFLSSDTIICSIMIFPPLGIFDHAVFSVSIDFPSDKASASASDKAKLFAKNFQRTLILMTQVSLYLFSLLELI